MKIETIVTLGLPNPCHRRDPRLLLWRAWHRLTGVRRGCSCSRCFHHPKSPHAPVIAARVRCARDSDWCDGLMCADIGNPGCPNSDVGGDRA